MFLLYWSIKGGLIFSGYEILQMIMEGPKQYFSSFWNYPDFLGQAIFWVYAILCQSNQNESQFRSTESIYLMTFLVLSMFIKTCFFIRIFKKFGLLVDLVKTCIVDIVPFTIFLGGWMFCFYMLYKVTGIESPDRTSQLGQH